MSPQKCHDDGQDDEEGQPGDDPDTTHGQSKIMRQHRTKRSHQVVKTARTFEGPNGGTRQFMGADKADVKQ